MPSQSHEALVQLFCDCPPLLRAVRARLGDLALPADAHARAVTESFSDLKPPTYAADAVLRYESATGQPLAQAVIEVQMGIDPLKLLSWPLYGVGLRASDRVPVVVVVIAPDATVARWCARPIALDPAGSMFQTVVLGPEDIPRVTDPAAARALPELAVLSAVAHGREAGAEHIAAAALAGCKVLDSPRDWLYADLVRASLSQAAANALEAMMDASKYELQSDFARKHFGQGILAGRKSTLLELLGQRFGALPPDLAARVQAADAARLERWLERILTAPTADAVLADEPTGDTGQDT